MMLKSASQPLNLDNFLWITSSDVNLSIIMLFFTFLNLQYI